MFIVRVRSADYVWYLRRTVWTSDIDRADKFDTEDAARAALTRAAQFMKRATVKAAQIIPAPNEETPA